MLAALVASLQSPSGELREILERHPDVAGVSLGLIIDYEVRGACLGFARVSTNEVLTEHHYLECASLSKTVATAFAIEYFARRGVSMDSPVNSLLESAGSPWRITLPPVQLAAAAGKANDAAPAALNAQWPSRVLLSHLVNHTALGMHYVYGFPVSSLPLPSPLDLLTAKGPAAQAGYSPLYLEREPGARFAYSGGGFIAMQHLIETLEGGRPVEEVSRAWLDAVGLQRFTFSNRAGQCAFGHLTRRKEVAPKDGGRLAFPAFAAGGLCTPCALASFLSLLAQAYAAGPSAASAPHALSHSTAASAPHALSHSTARLMLGAAALLDLGAVDFMRARVGLGVFVALAGPNKLMLHQAANEGFRGVYLVCFEGPDRGKGFTLLCNGDNPAVLFQCEACRLLLGPSYLGIAGVDFSALPAISSFDMGGLRQETIVNLGLKELVLAGFSQPDERVGERSRL